MLTKFFTLNEIYQKGIVAVIRAKDGNDATNITKACLEGGISIIEITFTIPKAHKVIETLCDHFPASQVTIGAGTVLDPTTARLAILYGAKFIVSPQFNREIALLCNLYKVPYIAGCMTITEVTEALSYGVDIIKLFPGNAFEPNYVKAIKGPLPQADIMPTGGVNIENITKWFENGVIAVGIGSDLTSEITDNDYSSVTTKSQAYVQKLSDYRLKLK